MLVTANVVDVATGKSQMTNDFRFTWYCNADEIPLSRHVVPKTYKGKHSLLVRAACTHVGGRGYAVGGG